MKKIQKAIKSMKEEIAQDRITPTLAAEKIARNIQIIAL